MPSDLAKRLEPVVAEAVSGVGFELDALEVREVGRKRLVKVVVDSDDGVSSDAVASASKAVSAALDDNDHLIEGAYNLEVTSPGIGRPLTMRRHWQRARHRLVKVTPAGGQPFAGRVGHAGEDSARVLVKSEIRDVPYAGIDKAVIEVEFKPAPAAEVERLDADEAELIKRSHNGARATGKAKRKKEESK